jgi:hypothetical protein
MLSLFQRLQEKYASLFFYDKIAAQANSATSRASSATFGGQQEEILSPDT